MARSEGSYIRWQATAIEQFGYAIALILSLAGVSLAFALSIVKDKDYVPTCWSKAFMLFSLASFLLSVGLGLSCAINRLLDIRSTRSIARYREQWLNENVEIDEIDRRLSTRRANAKRFGKRSWRIFWWQLGTFALGVAMLIIAFGIAYREKLF